MVCEANLILFMSHVVKIKVSGMLAIVEMCDLIKKYWLPFFLIMYNARMLFFLLYC